MEDAKEYALDVLDISDTPCVELGAAAPRTPRLRLPHKRPANNLRSNIKKVVAKQPPVDNFEKRFASLSLLPSTPYTSSSSLDFGDCGDFSSPSS